MTEAEAASASLAPPVGGHVALYQLRVCKPCGLGCPAGSPEMVYCLQARLNGAPCKTPPRS